MAFAPPAGARSMRPRSSARTAAPNPADRRACRHAGHPAGGLPAARDPDHARRACSNTRGSGRASSSPSASWSVFLVLAGLHQFVTARNASAVTDAPAVPLTEITDLANQSDESAPSCRCRSSIFSTREARRRCARSSSSRARSRRKARAQAAAAATAPRATAQPPARRSSPAAPRPVDDSGSGLLLIAIALIGWLVAYMLAQKPVTNVQQLIQQRRYEDAVRRRRAPAIVISSRRGVEAPRPVRRGDRRRTASRTIPPHARASRSPSRTSAAISTKRGR